MSIEQLPRAPAPAPPTRAAAAPPARRRVVAEVSAVAAAATLGAFVGFGLRAGAPLRVLGEAGLALRGLPDVVSPDRGFGLTALAGAAQHAALVTAWSALFVALAARQRGARLAAAAALLGAFAWALDARWLPAPLRLAAGALAPPERVLAYAVLSAALAAGTRLALRRGAAPAPHRAP